MMKEEEAYKDTYLYCLYDAISDIILTLQWLSIPKIKYIGKLVIVLILVAYGISSMGRHIWRMGSQPNQNPLVDMYCDHQITMI